MAKSKEYMRTERKKSFSTMGLRERFSLMDILLSTSTIVISNKLSPIRK